MGRLNWVLLSSGGRQRSVTVLNVFVRCLAFLVLSLLWLVCDGSRCGRYVGLCGD